MLYEAAVMNTTLICCIAPHSYTFRAFREYTNAGNRGGFWSKSQVTPARKEKPEATAMCIMQHVPTSETWAVKHARPKLTLPLWCTMQTRLHRNMVDRDPSANAGMTVTAL